MRNIEKQKTWDQLRESISTIKEASKLVEGEVWLEGNVEGGSTEASRLALPLLSLVQWERPPLGWKMRNISLWLTTQFLVEISSNGVKIASTGGEGIIINYQKYFIIQLLQDSICHCNGCKAIFTLELILLSFKLGKLIQNILSSQHPDIIGWWAPCDTGLSSYWVIKWHH